MKLVVSILIYYVVVRLRRDLFYRNPILHIDCKSHKAV